MTKQDRIQGMIVGLAVGDAVGTTSEFKRRGTFPPVTDMVGGGAFDLKAGEWTDDTSMALCIAVSLLQKKGFDADDIMRRFCLWMNEGYLSSNGRCFDIGGTVRRALCEYEKNGKPYAGSADPKSAGNGCLMRLAPVVALYREQPLEAMRFAELSSRTTHGAQECRDAANLFAAILLSAVHGADKDACLLNHVWTDDASIRLLSIGSGSYFDKPRQAIKGDGYVVNSLEAALWCFYQTSTFKDAILLAANLGDDADTTAAITGQIAGAYYGLQGIPSEWRSRLVMGEYIEELGARLYRAGKQL